MSLSTHHPSTRLLLALTLLLPACQSVDRPGLVPESQVVEDIRPALPVEAAVLMPPQPREAAFQYESSSRDKVTVVPFRIEKTLTNTWQHTFEGMSTQVFRREDDGTVLLEMDVDVGENARVTYDPPMVWMPATLKPGEAFEGTTTMTVTNLTDGSPRDAGPCDYTVELVGRQHVPTPVGWFDATIVRMTRKIDLNLADVNVTIEIAYVPRVGMVAETVERKIRALGLFPITKHEQFRLTEPATPRRKNLDAQQGISRDMATRIASAVVNEDADKRGWTFTVVDVRRVGQKWEVFLQDNEHQVFGRHVGVHVFDDGSHEVFPGR